MFLIKWCGILQEHLTTSTAPMAILQQEHRRIRKRDDMYNLLA